MNAPVRDPTLEEAATRLGSVYAELVYAGKGLDANTLPKWIEPERLRPAGGFHIGMELLLALRESPLYFTQLGDAIRRQSGYPNLEFDNLRASRFQFEKDLRVFHSRLKPALARYTQEALSRQERELRLLHGRFGKPGIEDELHDSFQRMWTSVEEVLPGGTRPQAGENQGAVTEEENTPAATSPDTATTENLPGGVAGPVDADAEQQNPKTDNKPTDFVERYKLLGAIKAERERRQSEAEEGGSALNREVADLLAILAVHPEVVEIARQYVWSPIKGTEHTRNAIERAVEAVADLRERLTQREPDDAWNYAPLVVGAITQLKLHELPAVPEFSVALGTMLGRTKTDVYLSAATILVVGLSLVFTAGVGAVVAGTLDLALAGTSLGITRFRAHEQDIAATASDFSPEDQKYAAHTSGTEGALDAAGALLSAIILVGSIRNLAKMRELLKLESKGVKVIRTPPAPPSKSELSALEKGEQSHPFVQSKVERINGKTAPDLDRGIANKATADPLAKPNAGPSANARPPSESSAEIEKMIAEELEGYVPPAIDSPLELSGAAKANTRPKVSSPWQVDMSDLKPEKLAAYEKRYPEYVKEKTAAKQPHMGKETYVRFRHGNETGQLEAGLRGPRDLSRAGAIEQEAGYVLEKVVDNRLPKGSSNNTAFPNPYGDAMVKPDHLPPGQNTIYIDSAGRRAAKGQPFSAQFVGDSKYVDRVPINDQTRGFINYARLSDDKTMVFYVRWQDKFPAASQLTFDAKLGGYVLPPKTWNSKLVSPELAGFANDRRVKILFVSDPLFK